MHRILAILIELWYTDDDRRWRTGILILGILIALIIVIPAVILKLIILLS
jgi:hypothetical protein